MPIVQKPHGGHKRDPPPFPFRSDCQRLHMYDTVDYLHIVPMASASLSQRSVPCSANDCSLSGAEGSAERMFCCRKLAVPDLGNILRDRLGDDRRQIGIALDELG